MESFKWLEYWDMRRCGLHTKAGLLHYQEKISDEDWRSLNNMLESPDEEAVNMAEVLIEQMEKKDDKLG